MSHLTRLANSANSVLVKDMMIKLFEIDNERDFRVVRETYVTCQEFNVRCQERREQMIEMQPFLHVTVLTDSYNLLKDLQDYELEKCAKVFDKKGIDPTDYCIRFKLADSVPKQGGIFGDCGVWVCIFLYRLAHGLSLDVEDPFDVALAYREKMVWSLHYDNSAWLHRVVLAFQDKGLVSRQLANLNLADLYDGLDFEMHLQFIFAGFLNIMFDFNMTNDMPIMDEVVFKIHKNGYFEFDPLRYVNGSVSSVSAFTCDRDIFPTCLDWICSEIIKYKWALFYCLLNKSLEQGLKLIHTDNDVHSFFADAKRSGKIHLYITHNQQDLGRYYLRNMVWVEEDAALRCSSSSPFRTRIKRKGGKTTKEGLRKKAKREPKMVDDELVGRKSVQTSRKGKEIMYEFPGPSPTKESHVSVTNYKRAIVNGKAKMVEVEDVGLVQPVESTTKVQRSTTKVDFF
ncbi:pentatricopeptide repeat-containing protein [Tanacetum coccineum]